MALIFNSNERSNITTDPGNSSFQFTQPIEQGTYRLEQAIIPITYYIINSTNNKFYFYDTSLKTATLTVGNYTSADLATHLQTQMNAVGAYTFSVALSTSTNKLTITGSSAFEIRMSTNTSNSSRYIVGYNNDSASSTTQVAPNCVNCIHSNYISVNFRENNYYQSANYSYASLVIPVSVPHGSVLVYSPVRDYLVDIGSSQTVEVILRDQYNEVLNFNGVNWTMVFTRV